MDRPLRDHLITLHQLIQELNHQLTENGLTEVERNRVEAVIQSAQLAVEHFRKAIELEAQLI